MEKNQDRRARNCVGLTMADFPKYLGRVLGEVQQNDLNVKAWAKDGLIPFTRSVETEVREAEEAREVLRARGASTAPAGAAALDTQATPEEPHQRELRVLVTDGVPVAVPKETQKARKRLARAVNTVSLDVANPAEFHEEAANANPDMTKLKAMYDRTVANFNELRAAVVKFVEGSAGIARASDLFDVPGGLTSDAAIGRIQLGTTRADLSVRSRENVRNLNKKKFEREFRAAQEVLAAESSKNLSEEAFLKLSRPTLRSLYLALLQKRAGQELRKEDIANAIKSAFFQNNISAISNEQAVLELPGRRVGSGHSR